MEQIRIEIVDELMYARIPFWSIADNKYRNAFMLIDTGANVTSIAARALQKLGCYSETEKSTARTVGGSVDIYKVQIPKMMIGSLVLTDVAVHSHENLNEFPFDGIIGMNVLRQFNFSVNFDDNILSLEKR